jgi:hypothetical protein
MSVQVMSRRPGQEKAFYRAIPAGSPVDAAPRGQAFLCARQQIRIDCRCPDRISDRAHRTRRDADPHNGHVAMPAFDLATNNIESDETLTLSATNPLGTRDEI